MKLLGAFLMVWIAYKIIQEEKYPEWLKVGFLIYGGYEWLWINYICGKALDLVIDFVYFQPWSTL